MKNETKTADAPDRLSSSSSEELSGYQKKMKSREQRVEDTQDVPSAVDIMLSTSSIDASVKDRMISARVNDYFWNEFKKICKKRGLAPNAQLNLMVVEFVKKNKYEE